VAEASLKRSCLARGPWSHESRCFAPRSWLQFYEAKVVPYCETLVKPAFEPWATFLKSEGKFQMNRIIVFTLLVASSISWSIPAKAQSIGASKFARQSPKASKKAAKDQRKAWKKYVKAQRASAKNANRHTRYSTRASTHSPR
jgi:hypothetical protein